MEKQLFQCEYCGTVHEVPQGVNNVPLIYDRKCPACNVQGFVYRKQTELQNTKPLFQDVGSKLKVQFELTHNEEYTPAKCRKPRTRAAHTQYEYYILKCQKDKMIPLFNVNYLPAYNGTYYLYKGKLYKRANTRDLVACGDYTNELYLHTWISHISRRIQQRCYESYTVGLTEWNNFFAKWLIVDGDLYHEVIMPCYQISTFGLGNNHGGTGFMVSLMGRYDRRRKDYEYCYYPHEYTKAKQHAIQVAAGRGDTDDVARFTSNNVPAIQILNLEVYCKYANVKLCK